MYKKIVLQQEHLKVTFKSLAIVWIEITFFVVKSETCHIQCFNYTFKGNFNTFKNYSLNSKFTMRDMAWYRYYLSGP